MKIHIEEDIIGNFIYDYGKKEVWVSEGTYVVHGIQDRGYRIHLWDNGEMKDVLVRYKDCRE